VPAHLKVKAAHFADFMEFIFSISFGLICCILLSIRYRNAFITFVAMMVFICNYLLMPHDMPRLCVLDFMSAVLLIMVITQLKNAKISDNLLLILAALGACYAYLSGDELISLIMLPLFNLVIGTIILFLVKIMLKKELMGVEELKIIFISGLFLSIENIAAFYLMICFFGVLIALYWRWYRVGIYYSFGLPASISLYFCTLFGKNLDLTFLSF